MEVIMARKAVPCPLGTDCPYTKDGKTPKHFTDKKTYVLHKQLSDRSKQSGTSAAEIVKEFYNTEELKPSQISDAKIREDGTISFKGLSGKDRKETSRNINAAMREEIKQGVKNFFVDQEKLDNFMHFAMSNYNYSYNNRILISLQKKKGSVFRTPTQWEEEGYKLDYGRRGGIQGASVRMPLFKKVGVLDADTRQPVLDEDGKNVHRDVLIGYKFYKVYSEYDLDDSHKEPPKHPLVEHFEKNKKRTDVEAPEALREDLNNVAKHLGVKVNYADSGSDSTLASGASGYITQRDGEYVITIDGSIAQQAQITTFAHEFGHLLRGHVSDDSEQDYRKHRGQMEAEAELFSYALTQKYGFDNSDASFNYLKFWSEDNDELLDSALDNASDALSKYCAILEKTISGTNQNEELARIRGKVSEKYKKNKKK